MGNVQVGDSRRTKTVTVDVDGHPILVEYRDLKWFAEHCFFTVQKGRTRYVIANARRADARAGKPTKVYLHRLILGAPPDMEVDHLNHNGLDNRRENLRVVTHKENCANRRSPAGRTLPMRIYWAKDRNRFVAQARRPGGRLVTIGRYKTLDEAVQAQRQFVVGARSA